MAGEEERRKAASIGVMLGLLAGSMLLAVAPQLLNYYAHTHIDVGIWAFVALAISGAIMTAVRSLGAGAAAGALFGCVFALAGGIVDLSLGGEHTDWRSIVSTAAILAVFGLSLGLAGGLPVWMLRRFITRQTRTP